MEAVANGRYARNERDCVALHGDRIPRQKEQ